jgi:hypothetical protein
MLIIGAVNLSFDFGKLWNDARDEARIQHEVLAALMGISAARLSDQVAQRASQHVSLQRACMLLSDPDGRRFVFVLARKIAAANGFDLDFEAMVVLLQSAMQTATARLVDGLQTRMAKAELRDQREQRSA